LDRSNSLIWIYDTVSRGGKTWEDGLQPGMPRCPPRQIDVCEQTGFFIGNAHIVTWTTI
jgi:hypothetical protein